MNCQQQSSLEKALDGHNLLLLGQSGTGKSFVVKEITRRFREQGISVAKTASTGIAGLQIGGTTLHRWSGYGDGRFSKEELYQNVENNEQYETYKRNILSTDCLIIDEVSMISCKLFESVEFLCRKVRNADKYFGGIQIIGVGDFFQLPPVADKNIADSGDFCFLSPVFRLVFPHIICLSEVMRQHEADFIQAVHEISRGDCSVQSENLLSRLNRKLPPGDTPVRLSGRRFDSEVFNALQLFELEGDLHTYKATSSGSPGELEHIVVPQLLCLKVGCPVLLVKNISDSLVNGMKGIVRECHQDSVVVDFTGSCTAGQNSATLDRETFSIFNSKENKVVASRYQIPLILAYSITIHKAQGLTLDRVEVDATNIFSPGQLGVAIGRAKSKKGLRVIGFSKAKLIPMSDEVQQFYRYTPAQFTDSLECCKYDVTVINNLLTDSLNFDSDTSSFEDSSFSDSEINDIDNFLEGESLQIQISSQPSSVTDVSSSQEFDLPFDFNKISDLVNEPAHTLEQQNINKTLSKMLSNDLEFKKCVKNIYNNIHEIFETKCGDLSSKKTNPKMWSQFYSELYKYSTSENYKLVLGNFLETQVTSVEFCAFGKVFDRLRDIVLEQKTAHITEKQSAQSENLHVLTEAAMGKIRYLGGRCVAKSKYHHMKVVKSSLYNPKKQVTVNKAYYIVRFLDYISTRSGQPVQSSYGKTLYETERKQNISRGLTHISDACFEFFLKLNAVRMKYETEYSLHLHGVDALNATKQEALSDQLLRSTWNSLFHSFEKNTSEIVKEIDFCSDIYTDLVSRFLRIGDNQFRKDCLRKMGKTKKESLRKSISKSAKGKVEADVGTPGPSKVKTTKRKKKVKSGKGKRSKSEKQETYCKLCKRLYSEEEPWVQCDRCDGWFDTYCQNIDSEEFEILSATEETTWYCNECQ